MAKTKKVLSTVIVFGLIIWGMMLLLSNQTLSTGTSATSSVDHFRYKSWDVEYFISKTSDGRAYALVKETITPVFPEYNQNRGIIRGLPAKYENSPLNMSQIKVSTPDGEPYPHFLTSQNGAPVINVGTNEYLHGEHTFVIEYRIEDVISEKDEFYWNMIDFGRKQSIQTFTSKVVFSDEIAEHLTGEYACYMGSSGSTEKCEYIVNGNSLESEPITLNPREGITLAAGLQPGSVKQPAGRNSDEPADMSLIVLVPPLLILAAAIIYDITHRRRNRLERAVVPEYETSLSPHDVKALLHLAGKKSGNSGVAAMLSLVVNDAVSLRSSPAGSGLLQTETNWLEVKDIKKVGSLPWEEQKLFHRLFPEGTTVVEIPKISDEFKENIDRGYGSALEYAKEQEAFRKETLLMPKILTISAYIMAAFLIVPTFAGASSEGSNFDRDVLFAFALTIEMFFLLIVSLSMFRVNVLTRFGKDVLGHIEGLKLFMEIAEADRIRVLQSADSAEISPDGFFDLYEKLLPYAVVFNIDKTWDKHLRVLSEENPSAGERSHFYNVGSVNSLSSFQAVKSAATVYNTPSSSSGGGSSGGSSGGGSAGGGGGGGFSGGR